MVFIQNIANLPCIVPLGTKAILKVENLTNEIMQVKASHLVTGSKIPWTTMPNATIGLLHPRSSLEGEFTVIEKHGVWSDSYLGSHTCRVHYETTEKIPDYKTRATTRYNFTKWRIEIFPYADSSPKNFMREVTSSLIHRTNIMIDEFRKATDSTKNEYLTIRHHEDHIKIVFEKEYITIINAIARIANSIDVNLKFITAGPAMGLAIMKGMIRINSEDWKNLLINSCNEYIAIIQQIQDSL
jgi:hypothetical protein